MALLTAKRYKNATLKIYNYTCIETVATFAANFYDASKVVKMLNDELIKSHGALPEKIFYFVDYTEGKQKKVWIDYTIDTSIPEQVAKWTAYRMQAIERLNRIRTLTSDLKTA